MATANFNDIGNRFGMLTVTKTDRREQKNGWFVFAACDCGIEKIYRFDYLKSGHTKSCGCMRSISNKQRSTHGHAARGSRSPTYAVYRDMMTRCTNPKYPEFHLYGGRGISVCDRWAGAFENFFADMGSRPDGMTIDRKDVNGNYEPSNCRWATDEEQANNKRNSVFIEYQGKRQTVAQWSRDTGIQDKTIYLRLSKGCSPSQALAPVR